MKLYALVKGEDETGVSGTGHIAWAVEFPHGLVAVTFRDAALPSGPGVRSGYWFQSIDDAILFYRHEGRTRFVPLSVERWDMASPAQEWTEGRTRVEALSVVKQRERAVRLNARRRSSYG